MDRLVGWDGRGDGPGVGETCFTVEESLKHHQVSANKGKFRVSWSVFWGLCPTAMSSALKQTSIRHPFNKMSLIIAAVYDSLSARTRQCISLNNK